MFYCLNRIKVATHKLSVSVSIDKTNKKLQFFIMRRKKRSSDDELSASGSQSLSENNETVPLKVQKSDDEPSSNTHFLDMNDDCIDRICDLLPLDDLSSMGKTCKRVQCVAGEYFQRHYPNNYVRIQAFHRRSVFYTHPNEKYVDGLQPFIRNVSMQVNKGSACVNYLKTNFCDNLREITLHGIHCELDVSHGLVIKDQLKRLESIKFVNCSIGDIYEIFLRHCQQLKHLGIDEPVQYHGRVTWAQHTIPTLNSIAYFDEVNTNRSDFSGFLRRNPQIKSIACKGAGVQIIAFQRAKELDSLVLCFESHRDFNYNFKHLKNYQKNSRTHRIKIEFKNRLELHHFAKIASIERVHGYRGLFGMCVFFFGSIENYSLFFLFSIGFLVENLQFPEIIRKMDHLCLLQLLSFGNVTQMYVKRLASCLPNLEELHFNALDTGLTFKNLMLPFCQNQKLKRIAIFVKRLNYCCTRSDMADINRVRKPFGSDGNLTIYIYKEVMFKINFKQPDNSHITLKPLSELKRETHSFDF